MWGLYHHWYGVLAHGAFPAHDPLRQYPPGAGPALLSPALPPGALVAEGRATKGVTAS
ncbi:hypothetical protein [Streptomyces sp. SAS_272]|uniref:hypothetical protein n=1 Tax=Streptomyces sp. SAS_272 TaxID=3412747 RepID=UPI00403D0DE4